MVRFLLVLVMMVVDVNSQPAALNLADPPPLPIACPSQPNLQSPRRVVTDISMEKDVVLLVDEYSPSRYTVPPQLETFSPKKLMDLCQGRYRFCPNPARGQADFDWYKCSVRRFVARVSCGYIDGRKNIPGMVYDSTRTFPVHGCHPAGFQPATFEMSNRTFKALAHNLGVFPRGFAHVIAQFPRLVHLLMHIPKDVPILLAKNPTQDQLVSILHKMGLLDPRRVVDWEPEKIFWADELYFSGEMGSITKAGGQPGRRDTWDMNRNEQCSWAMSMPRQLVQRLFTAGAPKPFHAALPGNRSTATTRTGSVVRLWRPEEPQPPCRVLVVHRKDASGFRRMISNHDKMFAALEEALPQCNVTEFIGGQHTLEQQIRLFTQADLVVGPHGAALSLCLFMRPGSAMLEIGYTGTKSMKFPAPYFSTLSVTVDVRYYLAMADGHYKSTLTANIAEVVALAHRALDLNK